MSRRQLAARIAAAEERAPKQLLPHDQFNEITQEYLDLISQYINEQVDGERFTAGYADSDTAMYAVAVTSMNKAADEMRRRYGDRFQREVQIYR